MWDKLDNEVGHIFKYAESQLKVPAHITSWSPAIVKAGAIKRYWRTRLIQVQHGKPYSPKLLRKSRKRELSDDLTTDLEELEARHDQATKDYEIASNLDEELRSSHLEALIQTCQSQETAQKSSELSALKALQRSEKSIKMFKKIRSTLKPIQGSADSRVDVPNDMVPHIDEHNPETENITTPNKDLQEILQRTISTKRKDGSEEYCTIFDQQKLETSILMYNHQHFQQARQTPFGSGLLSKLIGNDGLTSAWNEILEGTLFHHHDLDLFPELHTFILELAIPEKLCNLPPIPTEISLEESGKGQPTPRVRRDFRICSQPLRGSLVGWSRAGRRRPNHSQLH